MPLLPKRYTPPTNTEPLEPIEEPRGETNFPYRGTEQHGVPSGNPTFPGIPGYGAVEIEYEDIPPEEDAIPVRIVRGPDSNERRSWRVIRSIVGGTARQVVGAQPGLHKIRIKNISTATTVYISEEANSTNAYTGYPVSGGEVIELDTEESVYAVSSTADNVELAVILTLRRG